MQLTCPCCFARFPLEASLEDAAARDAIAAALKLPAELSELLLRYISLFRPAHQALRWSRTAKPLTELREMIHAGQIERNGRAWAAPQAHWQAALGQMIERRGKLTLPLKNHGYLLEILAGMANAGEARAEREKEDALRQRAPEGVRRTTPVPAKELNVLTQQERDELSAALRRAAKGKN